MTWGSLIHLSEPHFLICKTGGHDNTFLTGWLEGTNWISHPSIHPTVTKHSQQARPWAGLRLHTVTGRRSSQRHPDRVGPQLCKALMWTPGLTSVRLQTVNARGTGNAPGQSALCPSACGPGTRQGSHEHVRSQGVRGGQRARGLLPSAHSWLVLLPQLHREQGPGRAAGSCDGCS